MNNSIHYNNLFYHFRTVNDLVTLVYILDQHEKQHWFSLFLEAYSLRIY